MLYGQIGDSGLPDVPFQLFHFTFESKSTKKDSSLSPARDKGSSSMVVETLRGGCLTRTTASMRPSNTQAGSTSGGGGGGGADAAATSTTVYEKGQTVMYKGKERAIVKQVEYDDELKPYYTIEVEVRDVRTFGEHLSEFIEQEDTDVDMEDAAQEETASSTMNVEQVMSSLLANSGFLKNLSESEDLRTLLEEIVRNLITDSTPTVDQVTGSIVNNEAFLQQVNRSVYDKLFEQYNVTMENLSSQAKNNNDEVAKLLAELQKKIEDINNMLKESNSFLVQSKELRDKIGQDAIDGTNLNKQIQDMENRMNASLKRCSDETLNFASSASTDVQKVSDELDKEVFQIMEKLTQLEAHIGECDIVLSFSLSSGS